MKITKVDVWVLDAGEQRGAVILFAAVSIPTKASTVTAKRVSLTAPVIPQPMA